MIVAINLVLGFWIGGSWWGGSSLDEATAVARGPEGSFYVAGTTHSTGLTAAGSGVLIRTAKALYPGDVFVQKMDADGKILWRAILGGSYTDRATSLAVDKDGAVYVTGITYSPDFPITGATYRRTIGNPNVLAGDAFLFKLTASGGGPLYSTFYGGNEGDEANAVAVDEAGQAVIVGQTYSDNLPTTAGSLRPTVCAGFGYDGFLARFNATGTGLLYGTYLCGSGHDLPRAVAVYGDGSIFVAGETASTDFPVSAPAFQNQPAAGSLDAFALRLQPDGKALVWGTYFGGGESERVSALAVDRSGRVVIAGESRSEDLPGAPGAPAGLQDGFVARFAADGAAVEWTRRFGGSREEFVTALDLAPDESIVVGGSSRSAGWLGELAGSEDGFAAIVPGSGEGEVRTFRLGGQGRDRVYGIRVAGARVAAVGATESAEWLAEGGVGQGQTDAFFATFDPAPPAPLAAGSGSAAGGEQIPFAPPTAMGPARVPRWIVELAAPPAASQFRRWQGQKGEARESELRQARQRVRPGQAALRPVLERLGGRVYGSADLVANVLFVEAPPEVAASLRSLAGIKRVQPVSELAPTLDSALATHFVWKAWQRIGGESNAGAGIKVGIMDTGIRAAHPAFAGADMPLLAGFPRGNRAADLENTNSKVIVARGYVPAGPTAHADDDAGHGTGVAAVIAGGRSETMLGPVSGVAPGAYLASYKVLTNDPSPMGTDDALILALEDAVADGMDVVNMSMQRRVFLLRPEDDILTDICERMVTSGVMVVRSMGNEGPDWSTITSPHLGEWGILVGSHQNSRVLGTKVRLADGAEFFAVPGGSVNLDAGGSLTGELADVQRLARDTWGCSPLPADSLKGRIALVDRGVCTFGVKGENLRRAGATAMVVLALANAPSPTVMGMGTETLPGFMVSYASGQALRARLTQGSATATIPLSWQPENISPDAIADSSSNGPGPSNLGIKPDLVATGENVWTARAAGGFATMSGTSLSTPFVTGAMATLLSQRPGLDPRHLRSLLINTATPIADADGIPLPVMKQGAGRLHVDAALASTVTAYPTSLHLGSSTGDFTLEKSVRLTNLASMDTACDVMADPRNGAPPVIEPPRVNLAAGGEGRFLLQWQGTNWAPGQYEGHLRIRCEGAEYPLSIPYWHGVTRRTAAAVKIVLSQATGKTGDILYFAAQFRLTDAAGLPVENAKPQVTVKSGAGAVVEVVSQNAVFPGIYAVHVRLAAGPTTFLITAGAVTKEFTVTGQ
ncbi:MAG: S8 family serine peptidase [Acidobacteriota bacterium]